MISHQIIIRFRSRWGG